MMIDEIPSSPVGVGAQADFGMNRLSRVEIPLIVGGQFVQLSLSLLTSVMVAKMLSAEGYGVVNLLRSLFVTVATGAPLGLDVALLKYWGKHGDCARPRAVTLKLRAVTSTLSLLFLIAFALFGGAPLARIYRYKEFDWLLLVTLSSLPFACDSLILGAIYRARGMAAQYSVIVLYLQPILRVSLVIVAWLYWPTVKATVLIYPTQIIVSYLALRVHWFIVTRGVTKGFARTWSITILDRGEWREALSILRESLWMCLSLFVAVMMRAVDIFFVGYYADAKSLGEYSLLATIAQLIPFYPLAASQSLGSNISRLYHRGALGEIRRELSSYMQRASIIAGFLFAGLAVFGVRLDLLFGRGFHFGAAICVLLPLAHLLSGVLGATGFALSMTGKHREESWIIFAGLAVFIAACAILTPLYGPVGAAAATTICYVLMNVTRFTYVARHIGFFPGSASDLVPPAIGLALAFAARTLGDSLGPRDIVTTGLSACMYTMTYISIMVLFFIPRGLRERLGALARGRI
jgi:O-antigen/teichoic acid export membrane protein